MKITYLGHSSFLLEMSGTRIVTDPFGAVGFDFPRVSADVVTVSHGHYDHCNTAAVGGAAAILDKKGSYTAGGVQITAVPCFHDDAGGAKRGGNLIFRFAGEGLTVCHLGDLGEPCTGELVAKIGQPDVLLIPVGGHYTIDFARAKEYVERLSPAVVIPMHYKTKGLLIDIGGVEPFLSQFAAEAIERVGSSVILERGDVEKIANNAKNNKKIIVMERKQA